MSQRYKTRLMAGGDQKSGRYADGFKGIVMFDSVALFISGVPNLKDSNRMTRVLKECFIGVRSNRRQLIKPFFRRSLTIKCSLLHLRFASNPRFDFG